MRLLSILCIALLSCTTTANADPWVMRIETLSRICQAAVIANDIGTVKNIANQLTGQKLPKDPVLVKRVEQCLVAALGEQEQPKVKKNKTISNIMSAISDHDRALRVLCNQLLEIEPRAAIKNRNCRRYLID